MTTIKQNYSDETLQFARQASEQNRINRAAFNKPTTPIWKAALAGLATAAVVVAALTAIVIHLHP